MKNIIHVFNPWLDAHPEVSIRLLLRFDEEQYPTHHTAP